MEAVLNIEVEREFISIHDDMMGLDVPLDHPGMSKRKAQAIVRNVRMAGRQARLVPYGEGYYVNVTEGKQSWLIENTGQWKFYHNFMLTPKVDVTAEDTLAASIDVPLATVLQFQQKNKQRVSSYYLGRSKPIVLDMTEVERDLTTLSQEDISDMVPESKAVFNPTMQMSPEQKRAYADYLNPTGETPTSYGGDAWSFQRKVKHDDARQIA
jgi:hypothetical protein